MARQFTAGGELGTVPEAGLNRSPVIRRRHYFPRITVFAEFMLS